MGAMLITFLGGYLGDVHACGWHYETIKAEARSLPCTRNVALNAYPRYQETHLRHKVQAGLIMSALLPSSLRALDELAVSWILLRDLPRARCVLERRQDLAPTAYATHANWGTYFTFSGELKRAEHHVQEILKADPDAHFGRERDHLTLIRYLIKYQAEGQFKVDMYGRSFKAQLKTVYPVNKESKQTLREQEAALVSMISIYGATDNPLLFATLGVTLKQQGNVLLAAAALQRAIRLRHPQRRLMKRWISKAHRRYERRYNDRVRRGAIRRNRGVFAELKTAIGKAQTAASYRVTKYHRWLTKRFREGMKFWDTSGLEEIYQEQTKRKLRCALPDAQPIQHQNPSYPSHDRALRQHHAKLTQLLADVQAQKTPEGECARLGAALNQSALSEITTKVVAGAGASDTREALPNKIKTPLIQTPPQLDREHQDRVNTLNALINIALKCPRLEVKPINLPCLEARATP